MVKTYFYLLAALVLVSCSAGKNKCESYTFETKDAKHVQAMGDQSMYGYAISTGSLAGYLLEVMVMNGGMELDAHLVHPEKPLDCLHFERENWKVKETKDDVKQTLSMKSSISLKCGSKVYCFNLSYDGKLEQFPPVHEDQPSEEH
ncbi:MAG: hypothetical protein EP332_15145 [Bacteroidetes bacterium]|nr:MAG: hypothetical protein EP332_15145 [Bacteroidota bacterium]